MKLPFVPALLLLLLAGVAVPVFGGDGSSSSSKITPKARLDLIRTFTTELVYIRTPFPMGKTGLRLKDGALFPNGEELQKLMTMWGPSVKPGDRARITSIAIKDDRIRFEINGGPVKKQKWYQHIEVGGAGGTVPIAPSDPNANPRGSYLELMFDHYVPDLDPQQLKELLHPVFDFDAKSAVDAYLETVPPQAKAAIKEHRVLVGMNREMVIYAKGRAPTKTRERENVVEWEEWIYGQPPHDVDFVRFVGDEVVRVETMKVDGQKTIRTEKEVNLEAQPTVAKGPDSSEEARPANAPSLRRPGEDMPTPTEGPAQQPRRSRSADDPDTPSPTNPTPDPTGAGPN
jgi:hypothetical protein